MSIDFYRQLGAGVASLTFGAALSIFVYAAASGIANSLHAWLLFATSFFLMLRFWWRYSELFVQFLPSTTFWHFLFDFATAFFAILAVLTVNAMQTWALLAALAMLSSAIRCGLSWRGAGNAEKKLRRTLYGAMCMLIVMLAIYALAPVVQQILLAAGAFALVLAFVVYSSLKP